MYEILIKSDFCGAHNLRGYRGKCEELHGHNWKVEVSVSSPKVNAQGMVIDFKDLKGKLRSILSTVDHKYLNDIPYFKKKNPTSENIARFIHKRLSQSIQHKKIRVAIWETSNSCARFYTN